MARSSGTGRRRIRAAGGSPRRWREHGVERGDTVALMAPNIPAAYEAAFGVPMAGAVLNALNIRLDAAAIAFMLDHGGAKVLLTDTEFAPVIERGAGADASAQPLVDRHRRSARDAPAGERLGPDEYEEFLAEGDPDFTPVLPA